MSSVILILYFKNSHLFVFVIDTGTANFICRAPCMILTNVCQIMHYITSYFAPDISITMVLFPHRLLCKVVGYITDTSPLPPVHPCLRLLAEMLIYCYLRTLVALYVYTGVSFNMDPTLGDSLLCCL